MGLLKILKNTAYLKGLSLSWVLILSIFVCSIPVNAHAVCQDKIATKQWKKNRRQDVASILALAGLLGAAVGAGLEENTIDTDGLDREDAQTIRLSGISLASLGFLYSMYQKLTKGRYAYYISIFYAANKLVPSEFEYVKKLDLAPIKTSEANALLGPLVQVVQDEIFPPYEDSDFEQDPNSNNKYTVTTEEFVKKLADLDRQEKICYRNGKPTRIRSTLKQVAEQIRAQKNGTE